METNSSNILPDKEFYHSREILSAKRKYLKLQGLGNKRRKTDPFSSDDIDLLFQKKLFGTGKVLKQIKLKNISANLSINKANCIACGLINPISYHCCVKFLLKKVTVTHTCLFHMFSHVLFFRSLNTLSISEHMFVI